MDYNFNSNYIEGNTLTYGQAELLLLFGKVTGEGIEQISATAGIPRAVKKQLQQMTKKGYLQRREKDGSWHIFATQST